MKTASSGEVIITGPPNSCEFQNSARNPRCRRMYRHPAVMSTFPTRLTGSGSGCLIRRIPIAEPRNDTASTASVIVAPTKLTSPPPITGPTLSDSQFVCSNRLFASARPAAGISAFRCAPLAAWNAIVPAACSTPATHNCANVSTPSAAATGTEARAANRTRSAAIITGRFRRCSMKSPIGKAIAAPANTDNAASIDTWNVLESSAITATSGSAPSPTADPNALTVNATHNRRKSRPKDIPRS